ncbi:ABC transporter substrate-binding protein [Lederbergia sp. NSJ-179]|uniref:ABC transporter substrate-binding protein n=1 Tax=Lederbergia sp. NSJ-179 TaxID=2931402 RepID=UPI001FD37E07|nr:ABC transporter substrate-binding protein [Lederbergia sp. NSJ-179]MCJ7840869.1 ABC transporter substrate-binding protein [Lederbergia sp. NSJ-179]
MRKRVTLLIVVFTALSIMLVACNGKTEDTSKEDQNSSIHVALTTDSGADKLDAANYDGAMALYTAVYDPFVEYGEKGEIKPALAESWDISNDGKVYTFHLRKDVKFSDGSIFNADAALFSINRWKGKEAHAWLKTASTLEKVEKIDDYTVKMYFSEPSALILNELTAGRPLRVMSPNSVEPAGDPNGKFVKAIGTGAWTIKSYERDKETVLAANKYYWKQKPEVKEMVWKVIADPQTRALALQEGSIQLAGGEMSKISYESLNIFKENEDYKVESQPGTISYFLIINNQNESLQDVKVRQALNYAIDKSSLANQVLDQNGLAAKGLFAETVPFVTEENSPGYTYNLEKAKELLKEAGYGKNGKRLKLKLALQTEEFPEWKQISETIQNNLREIGVEITLDSLESTAYYDTLWSKRDYDLFIYRTFSDGLNPQGLLDSLFVIQDNGQGIAYTDTFLSNAIIDAGQAISKEDRQVAYDKVLSYMNEEAVTVPLFYPNDIIVHSTKIDHFTWGPIIDDPVIWNKLKRLNK